MNINITKELQNVLLQKPNQDKVYFDKKGRHYFNVFELPISKKDATVDLFGTGEFSHRQIIPGKTNVDKLTEAVSTGFSETRIVETKTRKEILDFVVKEDENDLVGDILKMSPEKLAALKAILNGESSPSPKPTPAPKPAPKPAQD